MSLLKEINVINYSGYFFQVSVFTHLFSLTFSLALSLSVSFCLPLSFSFYSPPFVIFLPCLISFLLFPSLLIFHLRFLALSLSPTFPFPFFSLLLRSSTQFDYFSLSFAPLLFALSPPPPSCNCVETACRSVTISVSELYWR